MDVVDWLWQIVFGRVFWQIVCGLLCFGRMVWFHRLDCFGGLVWWISLTDCFGRWGWWIGLFWCIIVAEYCGRLLCTLVGCFGGSHPLFSNCLPYRFKIGGFVFETKVELVFFGFEFSIVVECCGRLLR